MFNEYQKISPDVKLGQGVKIYSFVNLYGCEIGDNSRIGTFVEIQKGSKIGRNCKISSHTFICEGITIEDGVFIGHGVMFINDKKPRAVNTNGELQAESDWELLTTTVKKGASIGSGATIMGGITIGENAMIGAGAVVTKDVSAGVVVVGVPAKELAVKINLFSSNQEFKQDRVFNKRPGIAIIGAGYWGKNLIRIFSSLRTKCDLRLVCDYDKGKLEQIKNIHLVDIALDANEAILHPEIDAVIIATPTSVHYDLAKRALLANKHVFIEKPMCVSSLQAKELTKIAKERKLILMVDHTFLYTAPVRKIKELVDGGYLGKINYINSERINLGLIQLDVNVIYDLAPHDISIFNYIFGERPITVWATGSSYVTKGMKNETEEIAYLHLHYASGATAHLHVSWISPVKIRKMIIGGDKKMVLYDDIEPIEKIKIFNHGINMNASQENPFFPVYRSGDIMSPKLENKEALLLEAEDFLEAIKTGNICFNTGEDGLGVVEVLEKANESLKQGGIKIKI